MKKLLITTALVLSASASFATDSQPTYSADDVVKIQNGNKAGGTVTGDNSTLGTQIGTQSSTTIVTHEDGSGNRTTVEAIKPNGYVSNPNLTTGGSDVCLGSSSAGISAAGIGISGGSTTIDENCVMLKNAKILASLGLKDAAVTLLIISNEKAAEAISLANPELFKTLTNTQ